ncbi:hypothetical protein [Halorhodospira halochloris]|uniref:hypothetical protein n=1 Tax=Halorhodospira halochloris TaxID=1052 RepID=UPI001EE90FE5|nr:hypothetical protein [Halorhodospira halochloris]MCG5547269.1 hypothetical protein [Halorhodospira halochloris]
MPYQHVHLEGTAQTDSVDPDLHAAIKQATPQQKKHVFTIKHGDRQLVVKYPEDKRGYFKAFGKRLYFSLLTNHNIPISAFQLKPPKERTHFEAARISELKKLNINVPEVVAVTADYIVLEHCGTRLEDFIRYGYASADKIERLVCNAAEQLAHMHSNQAWHGAPQVRNIMILDNGNVAFIDFEENLEGLPHLMRETYDILQFIGALIVPRYDSQPLIDLTEAAVERYIAIRGPEPLLQLKTYYKYLSTAKKLIKPFGSRVGRDATRIIVLCEMLESLLKREGVL